MAEARANVIKQVYENPRTGFGNQAETLKQARLQDPRITKEGCEALGLIERTASNAVTTDYWSPRVTTGHYGSTGHNVGNDWIHRAVSQRKKVYLVFLILFKISILRFDAVAATVCVRR